MTDINRIGGKLASDALKAGVNAGMLYLKESKAILPMFQTSSHEATSRIIDARTKLRDAETSIVGNVLRAWYKPT